MIAIPAVDLRDGACVQLVGGDYDAERVRLGDPAAVARKWRKAGFTRLHLVDLDAATGRGTNADVITSILADGGAEVQVGGGVRENADVELLLAAGARRVVVGTRAVDDTLWLVNAAHTWPDRIIVAADVRHRTVVTHGWQRDAGADVIEFAEILRPLPLAGLLVTAVHKEGLLGGTDLELMQDVASACACPVIASGGIASIDELRKLSMCGVSAAVLGMALYTGALDPRAVAEEFGG